MYACMFAYLFLSTTTRANHHLVKTAHIRELKANIKPVFHLCTGKLLLKGGVESHAEQLSTDFEPGFPSCVYCHFTTENTQVCLLGSQEMHILSVEKWA